MRDIFGISGGVLFGLLALAMTAGTEAWWIAISVSALLFAGTGIDLVWKSLSRDSQNFASVGSLFSFRRSVSFHQAALEMYEALEHAGDDPVAGGSYSSPEVPIDHCKYVLLSAHKRNVITLCGARIPSRRVRPIPRDLISQLMPSKKHFDGIDSISRASPIDFTGVSLSRRDLRLATKERLRMIANVNAALAP